MDSAPNEYLTIVKSCFPTARSVQIVECEKIENLDNVSSDMIRVTVKLQERVETRDKKLILKIPYPLTVATRAYCAELGFYRKEKQIYETMVPRLHEIPTASRRLPVHYLTADEGTVVMEDLASQGYNVAAKSKLFDLEESRHIFRAMAEFHAATYRVRRDHSQLLRDSWFGRTVAVDARLKFMVTWNPVICELLRRKNATDMAAKFKAAARLLEGEDDAVYSRLNPNRFKVVLLNHGDTRTGNIMLKLNASGQIEDVKLVDFQTCWWSSPAYDFLMYLAFSVPIDVVDQRFDDLVDAYWRHLNEALVQLKCPVDYEKTDFLSDVEKLRFMFLIWLPAWCCFTCPLERDMIRAGCKLDDEETFRLRCQSLDDERFTQSLWAWLQYCEKIQLFDALLGEAENLNE